MKLSSSDKDSLNIFLKKSIGFISAISTMDDLWPITNETNMPLIRSIIKIDPMTYGFKGSLIKKDTISPQFEKISNKNHHQSGEYGLDEFTYIPNHIFYQFSIMAKDFKKEFPERKLLIGAAYRSPAFQILTLIYILSKVYNFDFSETLKRVALPQYSQHCSMNHTALDILNIDGEPSDEYPTLFSKSIEYSWLTSNANKYNFYESYPPENTDGIMWEPWHWQYRGETAE